ncbi:hypothetical protein C7475_101953 [Chitinophaga sp. S165]|nr:hypothetical protein C7475_101953 [Chitinophaga sp. S165]
MFFSSPYKYQLLFPVNNKLRPTKKDYEKTAQYTTYITIVIDDSKSIHQKIF